MTDSTDKKSNGSQTQSSGFRAVISSFKDEFGFLSNFYEATVYMDGKPYRTTEAAYQAAKSLNTETRELIRKAKSPYAAKKLGQSVTLRPDWESVKVEVMRGLVRQKFENPFLRPLLTATSDAELIESNHWNDRFWGVCGGIGQNWLGRILMEIRDEINAEEGANLAETVVPSSDEV